MEWMSVRWPLPWIGAVLFALAGCERPVPRFLPDADCAEVTVGQPAIAHTVGVHYRGFDAGTLDMYQVVQTEMDFVLGWADTYGLTLELALNGYQSEGAIASGEEARFADMAEAGHGFGVHHHPSTREGELTWVVIGGEPSDEQLQQAVDDHFDWIGSLVEPLGIDTPGGHLRLTGRTDWWYGMMVDGGYETETFDPWIPAATGGMEQEASFDVLHPFRWSLEGAEGELAHGEDVPFVAIPQHPQVGLLGMGEHRRFDGSVAHLQTVAFLGYLEWRQAVLDGEEARCWATGITVHPEQGAAYNEDLVALADSLQRWFIEPADGLVGRSMCPRDRSAIVEVFESLEQAGAPAFEYTPGDGYPYRLAHLEQVYSAHLVAVHDDDLDRGVRLLELQHMTDPGEGDLDDLVPGETVLVAWADVEEGEVRIDVSPWLSGDLLLDRGDGSTSAVSASRVDVGVIPVLMEAAR